MPKKKYSKKRPRSRQSWKQLRRKSRLKRKLRLFGLSLLVLFSSALFLGFFKVWHYFVNPKAQASHNLDLNPPISVNESYAIFVATRSESTGGDWVLSEPRILIVNKFLKKAVLFTIPPDLELNAADFGKISMAGLGRLFQKDTGQNPLICLEEALKIPVEGVFLSNPNVVNFGFEKGKLPSFETFYRAKISANNDTYTNLSFTQLADLFVFVAGLASSDLIETDWDQAFASSYMERSDFLRESLRLEVINGSTSNGVALLESEKLTALGIKVSSIRNFSDEDVSIIKSKENNIFL